MGRDNVEIIFTNRVAKDYKHWKKVNNVLVVNKIKKLIDSIKNTPFNGLGKPEPLSGNLKGFWSRRITGEHRLVYKCSDGLIEIIQCRFHY